MINLACFQITQHIKDILLLENISKYFNCGRVSVRSTKLAGDFLVSPIDDLSQIIIPFLDKYPLQGIKIKDYLDWKLAAELIQNKEHLRIEGIGKIKTIKQSMNKQRKS